ncbi:hypothetical protein RhiirA5_441169 [Rhizophagus irregularis]|uniref:HTH CENPB-type domain-containing protein n=1 Tax=Rhizophagus irregularis TaxID=588596 RepID=A0A2N0NFZ1_9GLOM|nr:hypothetical protein RhiirA5_441169 [Rhizophagus irregularis]
MVKAAKSFELNKEAEKELYNWIIEQRKQGLGITYAIARRQRTNILQKLPSQTNEVLKNFQEFIICLRTEKSFELSNILNMDETPIWFDMAGNFTINSTGEKTIQICRTGNKKNCFTVVLIVVADGTKFPSICIFKEKRLPHNEQIPSGIIVWCQQNG